MEELPRYAWAIVAPSGGLYYRWRIDVVSKTRGTGGELVAWHLVHDKTVELDNVLADWGYRVVGWQHETTPGLWYSNLVRDRIDEHTTPTTTGG